MNKRLIWVDNAKALGMMLVFIGHFIEPGAFNRTLDPMINHVYKFIYAFHMPFFFVLSGYFFSYRENRPFLKNLLEKFLTRYVPALFFVLVSTALYVWQKPPEWLLANEPLKLQQLWLMVYGVPAANWVCWFLVCLFVVEVLAAEIIPLLSSRIVVVIFLAALYAGAHQIEVHQSSFYVVLGLHSNWWLLAQAVMALFFYLCGYYMKGSWVWLMPGENKKSSLVWALVFFLALLFSYGMSYAKGSYQAPNMSAVDYGHWFWFLFAAFAGTVMLMHTANLVPENAWLLSIGRNTLPLIGLNGILFGFFNPAVWAWWLGFGHDGFALLMGGIVISLASLLLVLPIALLLNRFFPFLTGRWVPVFLKK